MKRKSWILIGTTALMAFGCSDKKNQKSNVVSERYLHKYGYDVSSEEWYGNQYPGQVITTMKNGVTIAASYEDGVLHGQTTYTYPHSQTIESLSIFDHGNLIKKVCYDVRGIPVREDSYLAPAHVKSKYWFTSGTPMAIEETVEGQLVNGEYFTAKNEVESRVTSGAGVRTARDKSGLLLSKETFDRGHIVEKTTFYANGNPHVVVHLQNGLLQGEKRVYGETSEPISVENYNNNNLDGLCIYYQNGTKYLELSYNNGMKEGFERHYIDGEMLSQQTEWHDNIKHGPSTYFCDGMAKTEWYYNNMAVTKAKFDEFLEREYLISVMSQRAHSSELEEEIAE